MKIYRIPLAEYIACVANIAFAIGKYITFGEAEYICLSAFRQNAQKRGGNLLYLSIDSAFLP